MASGSAAGVANRWGGACFPCFMPVNLDCPMDGRENMFLYGSSSGVPYPSQEVSMSMLAATCGS